MVLGQDESIETKIDNIRATRWERVGPMRLMARWWWYQKTCWRVVDEVNDRPVGNPKRRFAEYSSKFSLSYETKVINPVGKRQYSRRWCPLAAWHSNKGAVNDFLLARLQPVAMWNLHTTQPNTLFPTYDEVVNLTSLLKTKDMSVSSGKQ
jgi:hypothetical protein